jgi:hypothetical protein
MSSACALKLIVHRIMGRLRPGVPRALTSSGRECEPRRRAIPAPAKQQGRRSFGFLKPNQPDCHARASTCATTRHIFRRKKATVTEHWQDVVEGLRSVGVVVFAIVSIIFIILSFEQQENERAQALNMMSVGGTGVRAPGRCNAQEDTMATTFKRVKDGNAGNASHIAVNDRGFFTVTAVRNGSGNLELIDWRTGDSVSRLADSANQAGAVSEIATTIVRNLSITAVRNGSGALELISWDDGGGQGPIKRRADSGNQAGAASLITVKPLPSATGVITALRNGSGNLMLITWAVDASGNFTRLADASAGEVSAVALSVVGNVAVTAVRNGSSNLELIAWGISADGRSITRLADSGRLAGTVSEVAIADTVTAVRAGDGNLKLISWGISADGKTIKRLGDTEAGAASRIAISRFSPTRFVTAVKAGNGALKLIAYDLAGNGTFTRTGDSDGLAGAIEEVALVTPPSNNLVTAVRNGSGNLEVIAWAMQG